MLEEISWFIVIRFSFIEICKMPTFSLSKSVLSLLLFISINTVNAQCPISITGSPCLNNPLTANISGYNFDTLKWTLNASVQMVSVRRNPVPILVAGGGTTDASTLSGPEDLFVDSVGNIYIVDGNRHRVQRWARGAKAGITVAGNNGKGCALNQFGSPKGIVVDKSGNVYVSDAICDRVTKWAPGATTGTLVAGGNGEGGNPNQLSGNLNICLDKAGNIYIADRWNHRVQKWGPGDTTGVTVAGGNGAGSANNQLIEPMDVDVDTAGNIYVIDYYNNRVMKWPPGATAGILVAGGNGRGSAANQFDFTTALSVTADGSIFVRDQSNNRIQKWKEGTPYGVTIALGKVGVGFGLFVDSKENVFIPDLFANVVNRFSIGSRVDTLFVPKLAGAYVANGIRANRCNSVSPIFNVAGPLAPPISFWGPSTVSAGQTGLKYRVSYAPLNSYNWIVPSDATIVSGQGTSSIIVNWGNTSGQVYVTISNPCGPSTFRKRDVFVAPSITANY